MNENIDLTKILKNCPQGTKFYTSTHGEVSFFRIDEVSKYPVAFITSRGGFLSCLPDGRCYEAYDGECTLFPSKDQRDWSKFTAPWYKKEKFDPKTLKPLDSVIVRSDDKGTWFCDSFSYVYPNSMCVCTGGCEYKQCVPYNDETKHLVGTKDEAPEFYRYWED